MEKNLIRVTEPEDIQPYVEIKFGKEPVAVNCYDLNGHYIKSFNSITEACKEMKVTSSGIGLCLKKGRGRAGKYQWKKA